MEHSATAGNSAGQITPDEALLRLIEGNRRFTAGTPRHSHVSQDRIASLASQQRPIAIVLGCSDSRVPPELLFDQSLGDLFVLRLAGNIIAPGVFGSIQYAHLHLGVSLLVVLGHEGCGAVYATLASMFGKMEHPEHIEALVRLIQPGLREIDPSQPAPSQLQAAVEANVRWSIRQILSTPEAERALQENRSIRIVGAVYELASGRVRWLDS
jgi:carbonic anhydrase